MQIRCDMSGTRISSLRGRDNSGIAAVSATSPGRGRCRSAGGEAETNVPTYAGGIQTVRHLNCSGGDVPGYVRAGRVQAA